MIREPKRLRVVKHGPSVRVFERECADRFALLVEFGEQQRPLRPSPASRPPHYVLHLAFRSLPQPRGTTLRFTLKVDLAHALGCDFIAEPADEVLPQRRETRRPLRAGAVLRNECIY